MRLGKYTLECREFGLADGAHKLCASERHSQKRVKCKAFFPSASAQMGSPKILGFLGGYSYRSENPLDKASLISSSSIEESESCRGTAADLL